MSNYIERKLHEVAFKCNIELADKKKKLKVVPLDLAIDLLTNLYNHSIVWDAYEFEYRARDIESNESGEDFENMSIEVPEEFELFDRSKFEDAILIMIGEHDCNIGITWDTVDYYLNEYCKKKLSKI